MNQNLSGIDGGRAFDWGRASEWYAEYRDIYPPEFYRRIREAGLCEAGMEVLDLGTGTGVLPRHLYTTGARFVGTDIEENQIRQARTQAGKAGMDIEFICVSAEDSPFGEDTFDTVLACQCFFYFDHAVLAPKLSRMLKKGGRLAVLYMAWLPDEDPIAGKSEELVLRYNPDWSGRGETRRAIDVPEVYASCFETQSCQVFDLEVPFTRESWNGRMLACRGIGASLTAEEAARFDREHRALLERIAPPAFTVRHYAAMTVLRVKK